MSLIAAPTRHLLLCSMLAVGASTGCDVSGAKPGGVAADADGDGAPASADCNDANPTVYPGADELCDGLDNDCDGTADDNPPPGEGITLYRDSDADGVGTDADTVEACELKPGFSEVGGDCEDSIATISPAAAEVCDGIDNDCNGFIDDDAIDAELLYEDLDGDGFGHDATLEHHCAGTPDWVPDGGDCDDADSRTFPGAAPADSTTDCLTDLDEDGYGAADGVFPGTDCDDYDPAVSPAQAETCDNELDDDCDGVADNPEECVVLEGCADVAAAGLPDGTYTVDPPGAEGELEVRCVDGAIGIDSAMVLDHASWLRFTESVSNSSGWTVSAYTGTTTDGFWVRTERNFSWNGFSMCVLVELDLPWDLAAVSGGFVVDGYTNGGPDDDDGLSWGVAANSLGKGHVLFGAPVGSGTYDTWKASSVWGQDFDSAGPQTFAMDEAALTAPSQTLAWEYCDDGLRGEDIEVSAIDLWVVEAP